MMYSQGLKQFYSRGLNFLVQKQTTRAVLVAQNFRTFSLTNDQVVFTLSFNLLIERVLLQQE